jgi:hypothetical protein
MSVNKETIFVGLINVEKNWVFGCPDSHPSTFGLVPMNYLKFVQEIDKYKK